ncbi:MAG: glycosyltransferase [Lachnospiraceae bacterium]|nr:glycosyltransferase [Candidatus Colinaster scatohippi]
MMMENKTKVSLVIPAYNVAKYVDRCLKSIEEQTYGVENLEVILVDDASTDDTLEHLKAFEEKYPENVMLIACEENGKLGCARNIGMSYASGDYIMFVDSDDVIDVTMIDKMVKIALEYDCDEVQCGMKDFRFDHEIKLEKDTVQEGYVDLTELEARRTFILNSLATGVVGRLYKSELIKRNDLTFLEQIYYEDVHFTGVKMFLVNSYYRINEKLYYYFQNDEGIIHSPYVPEKVHQETVVLDALIADLDNRGLLDTIIEKYYPEFEAYCIAKSYIDPLRMMFERKYSSDLGDIREEIDFYKSHILGIFPNASENVYLCESGGVFALGKWLLVSERSRTELAFRKRTAKNVILMNTHTYINIGDHLITEATYGLINDYYPDYTVIEVPNTHYVLERDLLKCVIKKDDVIIIVGGGYLGSLWMGHGEYNVRGIVDDYPDNRVVIFPNTMYYDNSDTGIRDLMEARRCYEKHRNLHMILRDEQSYVFAKNVMPSNVNYYCLPDTALYCEYENDDTIRDGVAVCLRADQEKVVDSKNIVNTVLGISARKNIGAVETDMLAPEAFPLNERPQVVAIKAEEFAGYRVVITDRLHCMVYCAITGTPCVAFDNITKKVSGVYEWIKELPYIRVINDIFDLEEAVEQVLAGSESNLRPHAILKEEFINLASIIAPVDMSEKEQETEKEPFFVKSIDVAVTNYNCNFRCEYCYISQVKEYEDKLFSAPYDMNFMRRAFSLKRFGGPCLINLGAGGETLLSMELIPVVKMFLEEGHYVSIVTNGTVAKAFDEISAFPEELRQHMFIKFSFHFLELEKRSLFDVFWGNVEKMKAAGVSYTLEITTCDNLIPRIPEIIDMFNDKASGAMPHITIARDDKSPNIDMLTSLSEEEYVRTWGIFDSALFDFKMSMYHRKVTEYCLAGKKYFSLNLGTGVINRCVAHEKAGNFYDDITTPVEGRQIGCNCRLPYCINAHSYITLGLCKDIEAPTYLEMRDRMDRDGNHWVKGIMREVFSQKFL